MDDSPPAPARVWMVALALVLAAVAVYANSLGGVFVLDDLSHLTSDHLGHGWWAQVRTSNRPLVQLTFALNYAAGGLDPRGYHLVNLLIHVLAGLTLFGLVRRTWLGYGPKAGRPGGVEGVERGASPGGSGAKVRGTTASATWLGASVALLWLVHPLTTQAVTYTIERAESLMALFYLLTLYAAARAGHARGRGGGWMAASVASCLLGVGAKAVIVTAPVAVVLYDHVFLGGPWRERMRQRWPLYLGLFATWIPLGLMIGGGLTAAHTTAGFGTEGVSSWQYLRTQPRVVLHYLHLSIWPSPLVLDYAWPVAQDAARIAAAAAGVLILLGASLGGLARRRGWGFCGVMFFLVLAPTSSFVPLRDLAFEHRAYLPLAAGMTLGVFVVGRLLRALPLPRRRWITPGLALVAAAGLGTATVARNQDYHDLVRIWRDTAAKAPANPRAWDSLGSALLNQGRPRAALPALRRAVALEPMDAEARVKMGTALAELGQVQKAGAIYTEVIRHTQPPPAAALHKLGVIHARFGQWRKAEALLRRAVARDPEQGRTLHDLGNVYYTTGRLAQAERAFERALALSPRDPALRDIYGRTLARQGRMRAAARQFRIAARLAPSNSAARAHLARAERLLREANR